MTKQTMFKKPAPKTEEEFIAAGRGEGAASSPALPSETFPPLYDKDKGGRPQKTPGVKRINKQTNLPEPLIERGNRVAKAFFAGNFSELTTQALERFVSELEKKLEEK